MANIKPFKAIRPKENLVKDIASLPYDVISTEEAKVLAKNNPLSFLYVDKAEINFDNINPYSKEVYFKAKEKLDELIETSYIEEVKPVFYIYRQQIKNRSQMGIVACTSVLDYENNIIKKHELTREEKEIDRINHVDTCNAHTGPIFMTYRNNKELLEIMKDYSNRNPIYDFVSNDDVRHTVWIVDLDNDINRIVDIFDSIDNLYIADGHHRSASAYKVAKKRRENLKHLGLEDDFNYFLSILYPDIELEVLDYNRSVKDLNGLSKEEFIKRVKEKFEVIESLERVKPKEKHTFGMYLDKKWYLLKSKEESFDEKDIVGSLDVSILQNNLLKEVLGIGDPRTSDRIKFVGGVRGLEELEKLTDKGMKVSFSMYPTTIDDIMKISDLGKIMPPKSTWFEPKPRSGIFIHKF